SSLLDYEWHINRHAPVAFCSVLIQPSADERAMLAQVFCVGCMTLILLSRDGFRHRVQAVQFLSGASLGEHPSKYAEAQFSLSPGQVIAVSAGELKHTARLEHDLNAPSKSGWVSLNDNLRRLTANDAHIMVTTPRRGSLARSTAPSHREAIGAAARSLIIDSTPLDVSLECGHIHADRTVNFNQRRGLALGVEFVQELQLAARESGVNATIRVTPMVDDDHVINRLSYKDYRAEFYRSGLTIAELIMESSPIIRAVAHDVLRRALIRDGDNYDIERIGNNVYLTSHDLRVELIEDVEREMRNGCVLFEIALTMYRAATTSVTQLFWNRLGRVSIQIHEAMAEEYDKSKDPVERNHIRQQYSELFAESWTDVEESLHSTPFIEAFQAHMRDSGSRVTVFNILEDYYGPQQQKVLRVSQLLEIPLPLQAIFFNAHGYGLSRLEGQRVEALGV
ncbi:MAG: hypothetical protein ACRDHZ_21195, partial [Ktedonobacteraceae bacterium]